MSTFFLACVTIRTNFLKCFAVRAVRNALQPQISVINVVSNFILIQVSNKVASSVDKWESTFISISLNTKLRNMQHQIFLHKLLLKEITFCCGRFIASSSFSFSIVILNFIIMRTKNLYGINNKSSGVSVVRMHVTTCVTNKLQMNPVHLQQFLPNLHN